MNKITVTIITLNEEENIRRSIESAKLIADEVLIVDSGSNDKTVDIAKKLGAKVYEHKFQDYADQKNYAANNATSEWIFSLDADEEITPELATEIKTVIIDESINGYLIPRRNIILGGEIKHSRWSPDKHIWLWRKNKGHWQGKVHEELKVEGRVGELKNGKMHYQDKTISEFLSSLNKYTQIEAEEMYKKGIRFSVWKMIYNSKKSFFGRYILKQGYKDGWRGFILCSLRSIYYTITWLKLLELEHKHSLQKKSRV